MPVLTWIALAFFLFAVTIGAVQAIREGFRLFRALGAAGRSIGSSLEAVMRSADEVADRLERLQRATERLDRRLDRLSQSRAELAVLMRAFGDVRRSVTGVRALVLGR
jgi:hypothetical protein